MAQSSLGAGARLVCAVLGSCWCDVASCWVLCFLFCQCELLLPVCASSIAALGCGAGCLRLRLCPDGSRALAPVQLSTSHLNVRKHTNTATNNCLRLLIIGVILPVFTQHWFAIPPPGGLHGLHRVLQHTSCMQKHTSTTVYSYVLRL